MGNQKVPLNSEILPILAKFNKHIYIKLFAVSIMSNQEKSELKWKDVLNATVIVAALGYFVDVYDLVLFLIVGKKSLADIGVASDVIIPEFQFLLNVQMVGMLVGGIFWGVLGDKKGRLSVLFGSILMYSLANIANGFVNDTTTYAILRFVAGVGLAGELGAGITLVSEIMHKEQRGYGTMAVASIGVVGAVVAALVAKAGWQLAYFIGGGLGLSLLLLRVSIIESGMFQKMSEHTISKGNFFSIFQDRRRAIKYVNAIFLGLPVWFIIGVLVGLAPQYASYLGVKGSIEDGVCVMLCYAGLVFGDIASGGLSQYLKSRKKSFAVFYIFSFLTVMAYVMANGVEAWVFYTLIFTLGFSVGFWAIFVTNAAEQFGTNIRATTTTTIPNFVRGSLVIIVAIFNFLKPQGLLTATVWVAILIFAISATALYFTEETFGKELDYTE